MTEWNIKPIGPLPEDKFYDETLVSYQRLIASLFLLPKIAMRKLGGFDTFGNLSFKLEKTRFNLDCQLKGHIYAGDKMAIEDLPIRNTFDSGVVVTVEFFSLGIKERGILFECSLEDTGLSIKLKNCLFELSKRVEGGR